MSFPMNDHLLFVSSEGQLDFGKIPFKILEIIKTRWSLMSIYRNLGITLLAAGGIFSVTTIVDYLIFLENNPGTNYINPYESIQYFVIAILILIGTTLLIKSRLTKNS